MVRINQKQFITACDLLKKNKQAFLEERPTLKGAALRLSILTGFPISSSTMATLKESSGVRWQAKITRAKKPRINAIRILIDCVYHLYAGLGEKIPESLAELYEKIHPKTEAKETDRG